MKKPLKSLIPEITDKEAASMSVKKNRDPYEKLPDRLPTMGLSPLPVDEHLHIGLYESKQTLYLTLAHAYNKLMERLEEAEAEIKILKNQ